MVDQDRSSQLQSHCFSKLLQTMHPLARLSSSSRGRGGMLFLPPGRSGSCSGKPCPQAVTTVFPVFAAFVEHLLVFHHLVRLSYSTHMQVVVVIIESCWLWYLNLLVSRGFLQQHSACTNVTVNPECPETHLCMSIAQGFWSLSHQGHYSTIPKVRSG